MEVLFIYKWISKYTTPSTFDYDVEKIEENTYDLVQYHGM